ncbi:PREDICTED: tripartite motif-containing protein 3-like [Branchiostoma belcheri]|uniref:Tripartite motif-containing protein 3-like n=1 Tax=Branchiostoma belcheri TaxID=7741 RepID=A0A6P4ZJT5_BRABE|nr:PREDICTED: tripartite motif-containing protein 3-like [Branchiostoma belcheri]
MQGGFRGSFVLWVPGRADYRLRPSGIAVGTRQTLWVVGFNYVINYGRNGRPLKKIELEVGTKAYGVGVSRNTLVYVMAVRIQGSTTEKEIYVYAETGGVFIRKVSLGPTTSLGPFYITVSSLIYIADTSSDQVDVYSVNGEHVSRFGEDNRCGVELSSPRGLSTDRQGNVLVTSELAGRVDLYSPQGQFIRHVVTGLRRPKDVTVAPGGRLVVIDHSPQPVQIFKLNYK